MVPMVLNARLIHVKKWLKDNTGLKRIEFLKNLLNLVKKRIKYKTGEDPGNERQNIG